MKKLTLVLILLSSGALSCARQSEGSSATVVADPKGAVIAASHKLAEMKTLIGKIDAVAETPYHQDVEFIAPDKYHVAYHDNGGAETEFIIVGQDTYMKSGDAWNKIPAETDPTPTMRNSFTDDVLESITDAKFEGEDTVGSKSTDVYSYHLVTKVGNFHVLQRIWVDKTTGVPVKCYVEYTDGPIKTLTTMFDTDSPVAIEPPAN